MFDFGHARRGEPCAEEALHTWRELETRPPALLLSVHVHPGKINSPKLNPVKRRCFPSPHAAKRAARMGQAMLACCPEWRIVPVPLDDAADASKPDFTMEDSLLVLAARHLGAASFCLQDYALTAEGTKPLLISILDAALEGL